MTGKTNEREVAFDILFDVEKNGTHSHLILSEILSNYQFLDKKSRSFITKVVEGTLEYQLRLDYILDQVSKTKMKKCKPLIRTLLRMGAYQICFLEQVPDSAVCNETVKLAKKRGFSSLSGFVNGVLRNVARNKEQIQYPDERKDPTSYLSVYYSMPVWIIEKWLKQYDYETVKQMLDAFLQETKTTIRCNTEKVTKEQLIQSLEEEQVEVAECPYVEEGLYISKYNYLRKLKAFQKGWFQVQDQSSMLVGKVANIQKYFKVIDICAAPGGKSFHCAELLQGTGLVIARDLTEYKKELMEENLERLGYQNVRLECQDGTELREEDIETADVVIADLPCSGLGIIGKKSDIKYKMSEEQQEELVELQRKLLSVLWKYVKKGGTLIYSTCTINEKENEENRQWILQNLPFKAIDLDPFLPKELHSDTTKDGYLQLLAGKHSCDGFFIAKFQRI